MMKEEERGMDAQEDDNEFDIQEHVTLHVVSNGVDQTGWMHTHGMDKLGCADLEIRGIPLFLMESAARLMNHVAQYMAACVRNGEPPVKLGQVMSTSPYATFRFVRLDPIPGDEAHFAHERWALSDEPMRGRCGECESGCACGGKLN